MYLQGSSNTQIFSHHFLRLFVTITFASLCILLHLTRSSEFNVNDCLIQGTPTTASFKVLDVPTEVGLLLAHGSKFGQTPFPPTSDVNKTKFLRPRPRPRCLQDQDQNNKTKTKTAAYKTKTKITRPRPRPLLTRPRPK